MELRWLKIIDVYKGYDSRWDEEYTKEYPRTPVLQYRESSTDDWKCGNIDTPYWRIVVKGNVNSVTKDELIRRYEQVGWKGTRVINSHEQGEVSGAVEVTFFGYDY